MYVRNYDYDPSCPIYKAEQALSTAIMMIESHQKMLDRNAFPNWMRLTDRRIGELNDTVLLLRELRNQGARNETRN